MNRRSWLQLTTAGWATNLLFAPAIAAASAAPDIVPMKTFIDPMGLFVINVPQRFFSLRRSAKGDLPDSKTGQGRRGSSIFTSGDMAKAEVVAIERYVSLQFDGITVLLLLLLLISHDCFYSRLFIRFPTQVLLEENGIDATGDLSTFPKIGKPLAIASLLTLRRERDKPGQSSTQILNAEYSENQKILSFQLRAEIDVQKPELLMEEFGIDRLFRITLAKASLESNDGQIMAVFASALEQDYQGPDGQALRDSVASFVALDQSAALAR